MINPESINPEEISKNKIGDQLKEIIEAREKDNSKTAPTERRPPKTKKQSRLQAQAEIFGDQGVQEFSEDQLKLLKYSAQLSKIEDLNNLPPELPQELVDVIQKHKNTYINFLREEKKLETSFIENNIRTYTEKFQPVIAKLKEKMEHGNFKQLPEYLGSGSNGSAFRIEVEGQTYVAKFSRNLTQANFEIKPLMRAKGIPHTSQLVSYSFEDGVVVMGLLEGKDVTSVAPEEASEYSNEDIIQLIETVKELDAKGLVIDPKPSNFMYDKEQGFSVLDYHLKNSESRYGLPQEIMSLRHALTARKFEKNEYKFGTPEYEQKAEVVAIEWNKVYLPMMVRFLSILKEKYPDILADWQKQYNED